MKSSVYNINSIFFIKNLILISLFSNYIVLAQVEKFQYPKGLTDPTKEGIEWQNKNMIHTVKVLPNEIALGRMQKTDRQKAVKSDLVQKNIAQLGEEIIGYKGDFPDETSITDLKISEANYVLPADADNSLLPFFPEIGYQSGSDCAYFSVIYYNLTYETGLLRNWSSVEKIFSTTMIYNHSLNVYGSNEHSDLFGLLTYHGCASTEEFAYTGDWKPWCIDGDTWKNALQNRLSSFGKISYVSPDNSTAFNNLKQILANGYIVNFNTIIRNWYYSTIKDNININEDDEIVGENACYGVFGSPDIVGHSMTIVGYNDHIWIDINNNNIVDNGEEGAFKIANSWGSGWGNKGFMWFAYDALKKYSSIPGASNTNRLSGWRDDNEVFWLLPRKNDYTPTIIAEVTLSQSKRGQIKLSLGIGDTTVTKPEHIWYPGILQNAGLDYAFDGTTIPCDGSFAIDFTDLIDESKVDTSKILRWYIGIEDNTINDPTTIKSFKLIDVLNDEKEFLARNLPISVDNDTQYVFIDYKIGSKVNKPPEVSLGKDTVISHKDTLNINAIATDDGLPHDRVLKYHWEILLNDSNNAAIIKNDTVLCQVTFKRTGEYVLRLTVDDGEYKSSDDVTIYVSNIDLIAQRNNGSSFNKIFSFDNNLFMGTLFDFYIFNIANKLDPIILSAYPTYVFIYNIEVAKNYAYISIGPQGLKILDITDKQNPAEINNYGDYIFATKVKDNYAFLLQDNNDELIILDITNKRNLFKICSLEVPGIDYASCIELTDRYIYISSPFTIIDISNITNPIIIYSNTDFNGSKVNAWGEYISIDDKIINIKETNNPKLISKFNINGKCEFIQGNCAYVSAHDGLSVFDISDKSQTEKIGFYPINTIIDITAQKDYIYAANQNSPGLQIFKADLNNTKPYVFISADSLMSDTPILNLHGFIEDDGSPVDSTLKIYWTAINAPAPIGFDDSTNFDTKSYFYKSGRYVLKLNAYDGEFPNSDTIIINVNMPISIEKQTIAQNRCEGDEAYFNIEAHSNETLSYCWLKDGIPLVENERYHGVNSDSLFIDNLSINDTGSYSCLLSATNFTLESKKALLTIYEISRSTAIRTICQGENIIIGGESRSISGTYYDTLTTINGCDSIITTELIVHPVHELNVTERICKGESILLGGEYQTSSGKYYDTLSTIFGCDSIIITDLIINSLPIIYLGNDTIINTNDTLVLDAGSGYINYFWSDGSNEQTITISGLSIGDHEYSVTVTGIDNCANSDTIFIQAFLPSSLSRVRNLFNLEIYPNPTSDFLHIKSYANIKTEILIRLIDNSGRVVFESTNNKLEANQVITLNLLNLRNGLYILRINDYDMVTIKKIIKN